MAKIFFPLSINFKILLKTWIDIKFLSDSKNEAYYFGFTLMLTVQNLGGNLQAPSTPMLRAHFVKKGIEN